MGRTLLSTDTTAALIRTGLHKYYSEVYRCGYGARNNMAIINRYINKLKDFEVLEKQATHYTENNISMTRVHIIQVHKTLKCKFDIDFIFKNRNYPSGVHIILKHIKVRVLDN